VPVPNTASLTWVTPISGDVIAVGFVAGAKVNQQAGQRGAVPVLLVRFDVDQGTMTDRLDGPPPRCPRPDAGLPGSVERFDDELE
jgi:hypothetical protein